MKVWIIQLLSAAILLAPSVGVQAQEVTPFDVKRHYNLTIPGITGMSAMLRLMDKAQAQIKVSQLVLASNLQEARFLRDAVLYEYTTCEDARWTESFNEKSNEVQVQVSPNCLYRGQKLINDFTVTFDQKSRDDLDSPMQTGTLKVETTQLMNGAPLFFRAVGFSYDHPRADGSWDNFPFYNSPVLENAYTRRR